VAAVDRPGIVFGAPVMFGIPVIGSVGAATAAVFGAGSVTAGTVEIVGAMVLTVGVTVMVGTATTELTPRLPISVEPIGMPVRGTPPGVVGDVGVDDAARLPEPAPHMLWVPDVSIRADVGGIPDDDCIAIVLCGVTVPTGMPPPSKLDADPNIVDGAVPVVEHTVLPIMPVEGSGAGLTPGDAISVAPNGMPVPPTGALGTMPSGDVADSEGVGITAACCAKAGPHSSAEAVVIIRKCFMVLSGAGRAARRTGRMMRSLRKIGPEGIEKTSSGPIACTTCLAAAQRQGAVGMQYVPVVAIGVAVVAVPWSVSAEAMPRMLVQSETMRADVAAADVADTNAAAEASHVFAAKAAEMASAAKASDVTSAAKTAAHVAAATEAAAVTATTAAAAGIGRARQQARSEKCCCQYRDHPFHHDSPFSQIVSAPWRANFKEPREPQVG
jgi:hypothetical protein